MRPGNISKFMSFFIALCLFCSFITIVNCPVVAGDESEVDWSRTFGGAEGDEFRSAAVCPDGGIIITGNTENEETGCSDGWVLKLDLLGEPEWSRNYGGPDRDDFRSIGLSTDGGYILAGRTESFDDNTYYGWVVKLDSDGGVEWEKTFGGVEWDEFRSVGVCNDGGFIVVGSTESEGAGSGDGWVVKLDSDGGVEWEKTFGGSDLDVFWSMDVCSDGGFIIAGTTMLSSENTYYGWVVKLGSSGGVEWNQTYGGADLDVFWAIDECHDGGFIMAGYTNNEAIGRSDGWVVKIGSTGMQEWGNTIGGPEWDEFRTVVSYSDSEYIIGGATESQGSGDSDGWLLKLVTVTPVTPTTEEIFTPDATTTTPATGFILPILCYVVIILRSMRQLKK